MGIIDILGVIAFTHQRKKKKKLIISWEIKVPAVGHLNIRSSRPISTANNYLSLVAQYIIL